MAARCERAARRWRPRAGWRRRGLSALIALLQYFDLEAPLFPWVNIAQPGQAFGNLRQPNQLASLLVIGALALRWWVQAGRVPVGAALALGALLMAALAATASRVGLVALLACGMLVAWWALRAGRGQRAVLAVGGVVALYVLAALALPQLAQWADGVAGRDMLERLRTAESTCGSRLILWRNVLHLISLKPWTGWGWGELDYAHYITLYEGARFCHILDNAHNLPLHLAVELGVPVALAACAALAWLVWRGRPWAEQHHAPLAWGVLAVIGIHSLVEYPLWYGRSRWRRWSARGCCGPRAMARDAAPGCARCATPVAAAMLAAVAYVGWDYHRISQIYLPLEQRAAMYRDDAMGHAQKSWLYADAVRFAEVTTRPAVRDNAAWMLLAALRTLHFARAARGDQGHRKRHAAGARRYCAGAPGAYFRAAFPKERAQWVQDNAKVLQGAREQLQGASAP